MFPMNSREISREIAEVRKYLGDYHKYRDQLLKEARNAAQIHELVRQQMNNLPSSKELADISRQANEAAHWAAEAAKMIDPATIRALREASSSAAILDNVRLLQSTLGPGALAAAGLLTNREVDLRLREPSREEDRRREDRARKISAEDLRSVENLASSPEVGQLLENVDSDNLVKEAEAALEEEGLPFVLEEEAGEVVLYGIDVDPSNLLVIAMILLVALHGAEEAAPELVDALRQALGALAELLAVLWAFEKWQNTSDETHRESESPAAHLIDELLAQDRAYDEETWPEVAAAIDEDRPSDRKLFSD